MDAEGYPAQCTPGAGKRRISASVKKNMSRHFCRLGSNVKTPGRAFLGALPGVSVTELLAIESVFAISSLCDSFLLLQENSERSSFNSSSPNLPFSVAAKYSRMFNTVTSLSIYLFSLRHKLSDVFCSTQMGNSQLIFRLSAERFHIGTFNRIRKQFCLFFSRNQKVLFNTRSCYI